MLKQLVFKVRMRSEEAAAFSELIFAVFVLGVCLLFIAGVGSLVVTNTSMRVVDHLSAQSALVAYDRKAFDSDTGLDRVVAEQSARDASKQTGKAMEDPRYLLGAIKSLNITDDNTAPGCETKPVQDPISIQQNKGNDTVKITVPARSPWRLGVFYACLNHKSEIVGVYG